MEEMMVMRKEKYAWLLILLLSMLMLLPACGQTQPAESAGSQGSASASVSVSESESLLDYRIADGAEGAELMLANDAYYEGFSQNDLDFRMQKTGASMEEYQAYAKKQVIDFSDEQKAVIDEHMKRLVDVIEEKGYQIPELEQIVFINTTMKEECDAMAYTHGTQIYIDGAAIEKINGDGEEGVRKLDYIFAHEVFHCITRCNPDFRSEMYKIIHFTTQDEDFPIPESVKEYFISNPDVEHHNSYATFKINGKPIECFAAFVTTKHFEKEGDRFFDSATTALVPIDGTDKYYTPEEADNFDEIFGKNTDYVVDPEECMADNFGYLMAYGMDGPEGKGYPNPEIITSIEGVLLGNEQ